MNVFFYIDSTTQQQCGPFSIEELKNKNIQPNTMVWCSGMGDWSEASAVEALAILFHSVTEQPNINNSNTNYTNTNSNTNIPYKSSFQQLPLQNSYNNANSNAFGRNMNDVRPMPKNWLVESILVTVLCCLPFGIAGIVNATKVESLYYAGDYDGAQQASKDAKKWTLVGFVSVFAIGIIYLLFYLLFVIIIGAASF